MALTPKSAATSAIPATRTNGSAACISYSWIATSLRDARLSVEVDHNVAPDPYYPPKSTTVVSTNDVDYDFRPGVEVRLGSTFTVGDSCNTCGSGYGYGGCNSCAPACSSTMYAWEVAWWGIADDDQSYVFEDQATTRMYGMKSFAGLEYDRDGAGGAYAYRPVNDYYDYQMPIDAPPAPGGWLRRRVGPTRVDRLPGSEPGNQHYPLPGF